MPSTVKASAFSAVAGQFVAHRRADELGARQLQRLGAAGLPCRTAG
jgi:hypothetical protein